MGESKAPIFWPYWDKKGISTVGDICHATENRLLSHQEIEDKFQMKCSFLEALTPNWRSQATITPGVSLYIQEEEQPLQLSSLSAKSMYAKIVTIRKKSNAAYVKWAQGEGGIEVADEQDWKDICRWAFVCSQETKLQSFNYRVINRILPCGTFLKRLKITDSDICQFCTEKDTLIHYLLHCNTVRLFWGTVCSWFRSAVGLYLDQLLQKNSSSGCTGAPTKVRLSTSF